MQILKKSFFLFLALTLSLTVVSCSSDDNKDGGPAETSGGEFGTSTITLSGDVEGERSGMADFKFLSVAGISTYWSIDMLDLYPQTFSVELMYFVNSEDAPQPEPGTYPIGFDMDNPNSPYFFVDFALIDNQDSGINSTYYTTEIPSDGIITITTANEQEMIGTFEFTAIEYDDSQNIVSTVNVSGSFSAVPKE